MKRFLRHKTSYNYKFIYNSVNTSDICEIFANMRQNISNMMVKVREARGSGEIFEHVSSLSPQCAQNSL